MFESEIKVGVRVIDPTLKVTYTWVKGHNSVCSMCGFPSPLFLMEDESIVNNFGDMYRGKYCQDCAGIKDLQVIVKSSSDCENCNEKATVYAMDTCAGGWGGRYCNSHIPKGFFVSDRL